MSENKLPETSLEAYKAVTPEMLTNHHKCILVALNVLKSGTYEQIAEAVAMERHQIGRRLSELERMGVIYKPGEKRLTSTNRNAFVYKMVENNEVSAEPEKFNAKEKSVADYANEIISKTLIQKSLF